MSQGLGRRRTDAPDAWCFLRESYLKAKGGTAVKNFERWVYQRDRPGYETTPVVKIEQPIQMWMVEPGKYYDFIARKGKRIGFEVDDAFVGVGGEFVIKTSYLDTGTGAWTLRYHDEGIPRQAEVQCHDSGKIRTATFNVSADLVDSPGPFDLVAQGEDGYEPAISFLRVIKVGSD